MTKDEKIISLQKNAKLCRKTAKHHEQEANKATETAKYWNEAADNAEKQAEALKAS